MQVGMCDWQQGGNSAFELNSCKSVFKWKFSNNTHC